MGEEHGVGQGAAETERGGRQGTAGEGVMREMRARWRQCAVG